MFDSRPRIDPPSPVRNIIPATHPTLPSRARIEWQKQAPKPREPPSPPIGAKKAPRDLLLPRFHPFPPPPQLQKRQKRGIKTTLVPPRREGGKNDSGGEGGKGEEKQNVWAAIRGHTGVRFESERERRLRASRRGACGRPLRSVEASDGRIARATVAFGHADSFSSRRPNRGSVAPCTVIPLSRLVYRVYLSASPPLPVPTFPRSTVFYFSLSLLRRPFVSLSECLCARWWRRTLTNRTPLDSNELKIPPTFQLEERHTRRGTSPLSALRPPVALFVCCSSLLV